jgi:ABC-2 type transport system permease protein
MRNVISLLMPRLWSFRNSLLKGDPRDRWVRLTLFGSIGLLFWGGTFAIFFRVLTYFQSVEGFGDILANKLLSMVIMTFFALLIFSSIVTSLSKFYLSRDLVLVHSLPVTPGKIFLARWIETTIDSSWMVIVYSLPVFLSYGVVYKAGPFFYGILSLAILPLCLIASGISALFVVLTALLLPAGRLRTVFVLFGFSIFVVLLIAFRLIRPEQLVNPDAFASLVLYFKSLETPSSALLPTTWVYDSIRAALTGSPERTFFHLGLSWSFSFALIYTTTWLAGKAYFQGYSKSQTSHERLFKSRVFSGSGENILLRFLSGPTRALITKELKTFYRDQTQWPQVFLIVALIAVYLYNFSVLPLEQTPIKTVYLQNIIAFLNMGLSAFVLTAVAARFVFPAVSIEGDAFWIVRSAPVSIRIFLWIKFFVYYLPLLALAEILIVLTNILLQVTPFMMGLSVITIFLMVPGVVAMGVGLGAIYPDFQSENPAQSVTSFGGLLFMILCAFFIGAVIILEAGPVYQLFMADLHGRSLSALQWVWVIVSFSAVVVLCALALLIPMRIGAQRLAE